MDSNLLLNILTANKLNLLCCLNLYTPITFLSACFISYWEGLLKYSTILWIYLVFFLVFWFEYFESMVLCAYEYKIAVSSWWINLLKSLFYRTRYQTVKWYILFSKAYRVFNHKMISKEIEWSTYRMICNYSSRVFDHCGIKLENLWQLRNSALYSV